MCCDGGNGVRFLSRREDFLKSLIFWKTEKLDAKFDVFWENLKSRNFSVAQGIQTQLWVLPIVLRNVYLSVESNSSGHKAGECTLRPITCIVYLSLRASQFYNVQGGSNTTGTDLCVNKPHKSRSYLDHLV